MITRYIYCLLFMLLLGAGCSDFIEEDIENDTLVLIGPADGSTTETQSLTFWWEYLDGATQYRLQIVKPTFDNMVSLELDTLLSENKFLFTLYPGDFEWRVRAENSAYVTAYTTHSISIEEAQNISEQKIVLISPQENLAINDGSVNFTWNELAIADNYTFEIYMKSWQGESAMDPVDITSNEISLDMPDGKYSWGVKANDTIKKQSTPYANRLIYIDTVDPNVPVLSSPTDKSSDTNKDQSFVWNYSEDNEVSEVDFLIQISDQTDFSSIIQEEEVDNKQLDYTFDKNGTYYWRVMAKDKAGNESSYSQSFSLTIN